MDLRWLEWGKQLQAIAQNGLTYSENPYDIERYKSLQAIAAEILATYGVEFFGENEIPELSLPRVIPAHVARVFEHYRYPDLPTDFD
ncbi:MAG TPA: NUDIX hydrolase N-terminal domain-containing protein [Oculatellaceae cyanobacterium]